MTNPEIIVNLWYIVDKATGLIWNIAGRSYHASGTDEEKKALLKSLAVMDYPLATRLRVPDTYVVDEISCCCPLDELDNPATTLFEEVYRELESEMRCRITVADEDALKIPDNPLYVMTSLVEDENGVLTPVVAP